MGAGSRNPAQDLASKGFHTRDESSLRTISESASAAGRLKDG